MWELLYEYLGTGGIDLLTLIHIVGAVIAVGAVTTTDGLMMFLHVRPALSKTLAKVAPLLSVMVWIGLVLLGISGIGFLLRFPALVTLPHFQLKIVLMAIVFVNGIFINVKITPLFQEVAGQWETRNPSLIRFERIAMISGIISFVGWWLAFLIGWS